MNLLSYPQWFFGLVALVGAARIAELVYAKHLGKKASNRGEKPHREANFISMVALHALFFGGIVGEVVLGAEPPPLALGVVTALALLGAFVLRVWTLRTLKDAWHVRIVKPAAVVTTGPYAYIRHPNYAVVIVELFTLPLLGGCYVSAVFFSLWNALVLYKRIPQEEAVLHQVPGYAEAFGGKRRFVPLPLRKR